MINCASHLAYEPGTLDIESYREIVIYVPMHLADPVCSYISDNITPGIILEDAENSELTGLKFYVGESADTNHLSLLRLYLSEIAEINGIPAPKVSERTVKSVDWEEEYRKSIKPVEISPELLIRPPWTKKNSRYKYEIIIEPKMAFGTGHHETTSNCLKLIERYFTKGRRFLDFGCGSGILAIYADRLEAAYIKAIDNDPIAADNCRENFELNSVQVRHDILCGSIGDIEPEETFDMICANVAKKQILEFLRPLVEHTKVDGHLVLSGILVSELDEIETALKQNELHTIEFIQDKEWLTYCIRK